ncbi:hypothetical protein RHSIM_Rhsim11G0079600 [Rhododendron simsii]|uniref:Pus10 N-terminal eukaryotes domain-containing protein n=1 Tax=Rhododendron simsii TaxID=118357 RepID=A0A834G635_RHOSS|nr:hypothetical protein RHSIM_Rhsim11G0079600 [Rhododendron simsii]
MGLEGHMEHKDHGSKENPCSQQSSEGSELEPKLCKICLGVLQFVYRDNGEMLVKRTCPYDFAVFITKLVKQERHQIDNFSLEVSMPSSVVENEQAVWLYMKRQYNSKLWFQEKFRADHLSAKDFLKLSITNPLGTLLVFQGANDMDTRGGNEIAGREYSDFVTSEEYVSTRAMKDAEDPPTHRRHASTASDMSSISSQCFSCNRDNWFG